jgi:hypothetical protein
MKKLLLSSAALAGFAALPLYAAPGAHASCGYYTPLQDSQYVSMVASDAAANGLTPILNFSGPAGAVSNGHANANDICSGWLPLAERNALLALNPALGVPGANIMINDSALVYLGINTATSSINPGAFA